MKPKYLFQIFANPLSVFYILFVSALLAVFIAHIYKKTHQSISYSQNFTNSLVMLLPTVALVIFIVNNNVARAIGVFGAFSITRFRTPIKDSRDLIYIFWVLATGLAVGANEIDTAITSTIILSTLSYLLYRLNFGSIKNYDYLLIYKISIKKNDLNLVKKTIKNIVESFDILNIQTLPDNKNMEISASIKLKNNKSPEDILTNLKKQKSITSINISPYKNSVEY